jgi:hypothetical protein
LTSPSFDFRAYLRSTPADSRANPRARFIVIALGAVSASEEGFVEQLVRQEFGTPQSKIIIASEYAVHKPARP